LSPFFKEDEEEVLYDIVLRHAQKAVSHLHIMHDKVDIGPELDAAFQFYWTSLSRKVAEGQKRRDDLYIIWGMNKIYPRVPRDLSTSLKALLNKIKKCAAP